MNDLGISTSWNTSRDKEAAAIIDEIKACGFTDVELSFTLTEEKVKEISSIARDGKIRVRSLHNYCPVPHCIKWTHISPDHYSLSSLNEDERRKALYFTKRTIETASALGAQAVILHCGRVDSPDVTRDLILLYNAGRKGSSSYLEKRDGMILDRRFRSSPHIDAVLKSLDELNIYAEKKDVILGIENRFYFMEMPSFEEIGVILERFKNSSLRYWHDVGHAQLFEELGLANHADFLKNFGVGMAGVHLHDTNGCQDHLAPGFGNFDFYILKPYLTYGTIKIIEAHQPASRDQILYARQYLEKILLEAK